MGFGWTIAINGCITPFNTVAIYPVLLTLHTISAVLGGIVGCGASGFSKFRVDDYKKILAIGCEEASKWSTFVPTSPVDANSENGVLEKELQKRGQPIPVWIFPLVHQWLQGSLF